MTGVKTQNTKEALKIVRERIKELNKAKVKVSKNVTSVYFEVFESTLPLTIIRDILNVFDKTDVREFTHYRKDAETLCICYGPGTYELHSLGF